MDATALLARLDATFTTDPPERRAGVARLISILHPVRETFEAIARQLVPANEPIFAELLERLACGDIDLFVETVDEIQHGARPERRQLLQARFNRPMVLNALATRLTALLDAGDAATAERIVGLLSLHVDERAVVNVVRGLFKGDVLVPAFDRILKMIDGPKIVAEIDRNKDCGDPRFLFNAILYLKGIGERTLALKLVEIYSRLEYGLTADEAAKRIGEDLRRKPRDPNAKLLLVVSGSQAITTLVARAVEGLLAVEAVEEDSDFVVRERVIGDRPDLVIVDRAFGGGRGVAIARALAEGRLEAPLVVAFDRLAEEEKATLFSAGIRDYLSIPFTLEELRDKATEILERADHARVMKKAQVAFAPGEAIFQEGDPGDGCFIVKSGKVRIWRRDAAGHEIHLITLAAGEIFGEMAIIDKSPRSASATAEEKTELLRIAEENFEKVIQSNAGFAMKMIGILVKRLRNVTDRLKELETRERSGKP